MFRCTNFFRASPEIFVPKNRLQKYFWNRYQQWISVHLLHGHWLKKPWVTPLLHHAKPIISPSFEHIIQCFPRYFIFFLTSPIDKNFHKISMLGIFWAFSAIFPWFYKDNKGAPLRNPLPLAPRSMAKSLLILCHLGLAAALSPGDRKILGTGTSGKVGPRVSPGFQQEKWPLTLEISGVWRCKKNI